MLQDFYNFFPRVLFELWPAWFRLEARIIEALVELRSVWRVTSRYANNLVKFALIVSRRAEEHIEGAVIENDDELVRVGAFRHGLKPANMVNFTALLHRWLVVILDDCAFLNQLRIVAAYKARVSAQEKLNLWLVLTLLLVEMLLIVVILA